MAVNTTKKHNYLNNIQILIAPEALLFFAYFFLSSYLRPYMIDTSACVIVLMATDINRVELQ